MELMVGEGEFEEITDYSKLPILYRYIPKNYVNDFFEDGSLNIYTLQM